MRKLVFALVSSALAANLLGACAIPDDGKNDLKGRITIADSLISTIVMPGTDGADADCDGATAWGGSPAIGDVTPTVYVGLYTRPVDPTNNDFDPSDPTAWFKGCGSIDEDDDPVTPPVEHRESCPVGGTTGEYHAPSAAEPWHFDFNILFVPDGTYFLYAWLDNKCAETNDETANLVWDLGGPPDAGDLVPSAAVEVNVNENKDTFDGDPATDGIQPLVLGSALN